MARGSASRLCAALGLPRATYYRHLDATTTDPATDAGPRALGRRDAGRCWTSCTSRASWTWRRPRSTRRCSTRSGTSARSGPCIASWPRMRRSGSGATQLRHPEYKKPELLATAPNQVWSWDITKLLGPAQVDLLLPVRAHRHLQPLRRRLAARPSRERRAGEEARRRVLPAAEHPARTAQRPCRPRHRR